MRWGPRRGRSVARRRRRGLEVGRTGDLYGDLGVIGATVDGGYAEKCLAPASHVYAIPDEMSFDHAATFPTAYLTAAHALFDGRRGLQAGETVMIHAAGSGVSTAAIQLAKQAGATVLATAGTDEKCERALALGADHVANNRDSRCGGLRAGESPAVHGSQHGSRPRWHRTVWTVAVRIGCSRTTRQLRELIG